jgi:serine phosphatase RsbU (regulator of sigma subunit)
VRSHILLREARDQLAEQLDALNAELEMARKIQLSILPQALPKLDGLNIAVHFRPMASVGGDFYDFIRIDDKHLGILLADVSGHGLPSALIASMLQVALSGQVDHASEPGKVLAGLNKALCGKFTENFVTAAYVYVDLEQSLIRYAGAGHPPVVRYRSLNSKADTIMENGIVLGMVDAATYEALELPLESGDRYVLYTDGVIETANPNGELYGTDRLMRFVEREHTQSTQQFTDAIFDEITRWSEQANGTAQQDDITILLFDFGAGPGLVR